MISQIEKILKIFADQNRIRIFKLLEKRKMCVCELAYVLGVTQPSISRHLKKMKSVGLVKDEQDGFWTNYYLARNFAQTQKIMQCVSHWLKDDGTIKSDAHKLKKVDRTKVCCR